MTAEVAIANKYGVALSADSAVTIGGKKIYNSANKLFALTKHHPVGIMIFGSAQMNGVPWETLIKFYRSRVLRDNKFSSLEDYKNDFIRFIRDTALITDEAEELQVKRYFASVTKKVVGHVVQIANGLIQKSGSITRLQTAACVKLTIDTWLKSIAHSTITAADKKQYLIKYQAHLEAMTLDVFENLPLTKPYQKKLITGILMSLHTSVPCADDSGIVIAGFGEDDVFPSIARFSVECRYRKILKVTSENLSKISQTNRSTIVPFAQKEMVTMFMTGIDPEYRAAIADSVSKIITEVPDLLRAKHGIAIPNNVKAAITSDLKDLHKNFMTGLADLQHRQFVRPVINSVAALPLDELAAMANALVNLTSFKRRVTMVLESVGGPVDTAVISKGDGFIWINRKHYFKPELNPHYFDNCSQELQ